MGDVIVGVSEGKLLGKSFCAWNGRTYYSFQGIPYAKPPIGELRFKAPQPIGKWNGIKDATIERSECISRHIIHRTIVGSEDCLFLNVFTPELPDRNFTQKLKPVMVFIHGGAFTGGSSRAEMYSPDFLINHGVLLVTLNYRVGVLGFLSLKDPSLGVPGNAGLKDQVLALKWVQKNIENFGGDPNNVTIFGESAGATSVHLLVLSPMAEGLFHKAIVQSGSAILPWAITRSPVHILANILECPFLEENEILDFLRKQPAEKIMLAQEQLPGMFKANAFSFIGPVVEEPFDLEENFITELPIEILKRGKYNKVPLIFGYASCEGMMFEMVSSINPTIFKVDDFEEYIPHTLNIEKGSTVSLELANKIKEIYYGDDEVNEENKHHFYTMTTDIFFLYDIYRSAKLHFQTSDVPIYLYKFSVEASLNIFKGIIGIKLPGACHADELGYLFKTFLTPNKLSVGSLEALTIKRMTTFWTNFARTGNPNPEEDVSGITAIWDTIKEDALNYVEIGEQLANGVNPEAERMAFWDSVTT